MEPFAQVDYNIIYNSGIYMEDNVCPRCGTINCMRFPSKKEIGCEKCKKDGYNKGIISMNYDEATNKAYHLINNKES